MKNLVGRTHLCKNIRGPMRDCSSLGVTWVTLLTFLHFLKISFNFSRVTDTVLLVVFTMTPKQLQISVGGASFDLLIGKPNLCRRSTR